MRFFLVFAAAACWAATSHAQLNCGVTVDLQQVQSTEYEFLEDLEPDVEEYLNTTRWSEDRFEDEELINCTVQISIGEPISLSRFRAQIVVVGQRPIYGTASSSLVFRILDSDWTFDYNRGQPLVLDFNRFDSFTSVLDFYALLLMGYDYDTFSELGGTPYFQRALEIAERAAGIQAEGWVSFGEDQTRTTLIRQLTGERYTPLRRGYFVYHFGGLDRFLSETEEAQADVYAVVQSLSVLFNELNARRYATDVFFGAKASEIVQILRDFEDAPQALDLLLEMDPTRRNVYEGLLN